jgi:hypothetical protein
MQRAVEKLTAENTNGVLATDRIGSASQQWQKWQRQQLFTNRGDAQLEQSNSPQSLHAEARSSIDDRFLSMPEITISRYADF